MNPMATATDQLYPSAQMNHMPPTSANGSDSITMSVSPTLLEIEIQEKEDDRERRGNHESHPLLRALHVLELSAPYERVPGRHLHIARNDLLRLGHVAADISTGDIHIDPCRRNRPFRAHHHRPSSLANRRYLAERDLRAAGSHCRRARARTLAGTHRASAAGALEVAPIV